METRFKPMFLQSWLTVTFNHTQSSNLKPYNTCLLLGCQSCTLLFICCFGLQKLRKPTDIFEGSRHPIGDLSFSSPAVPKLCVTMPLGITRHLLMPWKMLTAHQGDHAMLFQTVKVQEDFQHSLTEYLEKPSCSPWQFGPAACYLISYWWEATKQERKTLFFQRHTATEPRYSAWPSHFIVALDHQLLLITFDHQLPLGFVSSMHMLPYWFIQLSF